jgi:uncharacterized MAPEG superfamily protein
MIIEIISLCVLSIFFMFAWLPTSVAKAKTYGWVWLLSNRTSLPGPLPEWAARCDRAHKNLKDYFPSFAVAALLCLHLGIGDTFSAMACMVFVVMRLFHFTAYALGMPMFRAQSFFIALVANLFLYVQIIIFLIHGQTIGS